MSWQAHPVVATATILFFEPPDGALSMQNELEAFLALAGRFPIIGETVGLNDSGSAELRQKHGFIGLSSRCINVCILADWKYSVKAESLRMESRFMAQRRPSAIVEAGEGEYFCDVRCALKDVARLNASSGMLEQIYNRMGRNPHLRFPDWDKSDASSIFGALRKAGYMGENGADFLIFGRHLGHTGDFRKLLFAGGKSGLRCLANSGDMDEISRAWAGKSEFMAYFGNGKFRLERLPSGALERLRLIEDRLSRLPKTDPGWGARIHISNTSCGGIACVLHHKGEDRFWQLQAVDAKSEKPHARAAADALSEIWTGLKESIPTSRRDRDC